MSMFFVAAGAGHALAAGGKPVINQKKEYYQARWVWSGVLKVTADPNNVSLIQFNTPTAAVYCYKTKCLTVSPKVGANGVFTFSTNGRDLFQFKTVSGSTIQARYWQDGRTASRTPDAAAVFQRKN